MGEVQKTLVQQEVDNLASGLATQVPLPKPKDVTLNGVVTRILLCPGGNAHARKLMQAYDRGVTDDDKPGIVLAVDMIQGASNWIYGPFIISLSPSKKNIAQLPKIRAALDDIWR